MTDPRKLFFDERLTAFCVYCGGVPDTRDHVPSKVLLDEPFPPELPVVGSCKSCNGGFSKDEQYLACLLECVQTGSVRPEDMKRNKIRRLLTENPALAARIENSRTTDTSGTILWHHETERVRSIVLKLARGHAAYELSEPQAGTPDLVWFAPLLTMTESDRHAFESPETPEILFWPEIGSRAFIRAVLGSPQIDANGWLTVQDGRYRYMVNYHYGIDVRMVLSEYLACRVVWR